MKFYSAPLLFSIVSATERLKNVPDDFCSTLGPGLFCHPSEGTNLIFCKSLTSLPIVSACAGGQVCRSHAKLSKFITSQLIELKAWAFTQCVPMDDEDFNDYCEDKLSALKSMNSDDADAISIVSSFNDDLTLLAHIRACNPFTGAKRQLLSCLAVEKKCAFRFNEECIDAVEIRKFVSKCDGFTGCRSYDNPTSKDKKAQCLPSTYYMCLDRFYTTYSEEFVTSLSKMNPLPQVANLNFHFCDPAKKSKQLECKIVFDVSIEPNELKVSLLSQEDQEKLKFNLKNFHYGLFQQIYSQETSKPSNIVLSPQKIQIIHHFCPVKTVKLMDIRERDDTFDHHHTISGSICQQLTPKLSRCLAAPAVDPETIAKEFKSDELPMLSLEVAADSYVGFCAGRTSPGQYCVPGWPDVGIICPFGTLVQCKRPRDDSLEGQNDFDDAWERCTQLYGEYPSVYNSSDDAFRQQAVLDLNGRELSYGWYAKCQKGPILKTDVSEELPTDLTHIETL